MIIRHSGPRNRPRLSVYPKIQGSGSDKLQEIIRRLTLPTISVGSESAPSHLQRGGEPKTDAFEPSCHTSRRALEFSNDYRSLGHCVLELETPYRGLSRLIRNRRTMKYTGILQIFSILTGSRPEKIARPLCRGEVRSRFVGTITRSRAQWRI